MRLVCSDSGIDWGVWGAAPPSLRRCGHTDPAVGGSSGDTAPKLNEPPEVVGKVGHPDLRARPGETDRADDQPHGLLLYREHMLDRSPVARAPGIAAADVCREWSARPAAAVDVADESVPLKERLVLLRAIGGVGPDAGAGVRGVEQASAQQPAVVPAGVGDVPAADQSIPSVDARVGLGAEARDRNVQHRTIPIAWGLAGLDRPTGVHVFLTRLRRLIRPDFVCRFLRLRALLLVPRIALLAHAC